MIVHLCCWLQSNCQSAEVIVACYSNKFSSVFVEDLLVEYHLFIRIVFWTNKVFIIVMVYSIDKYGKYAQRYTHLYNFKMTSS